jgi:hypothetical protein
MRDKPMSGITERAMLVRVSMDLPIALTTNEFRDGWHFVCSDEACRLGAMIKAHSGQYNRVVNSLMRSGVGETSQAAIASALKLALHQVSGNLNAVRIERITLTEYPWFCLARVNLYPCWIQRDVILPVAKEEISLSIPRRERQLPYRVPELYPNFGIALPLLKQMLVLSQSQENRQQ